MGKLLRHEFYKFFTSKASYIIFGIPIVMMIALAAIGVPFRGQEMMVMFFGAMSGFWSLFLVIFISQNVSTDYGKGIVRNMIMSGHTRNKVYFAKLILCVVVSVVVVVLMSLIVAFCNRVGIVQGLGFESFLIEQDKFWVFMGLILLSIVAFVVFIFAMANLTKSIGATIGIAIGASILFPLLPVFGSLANSNTVIQILDFVSKLYVGSLFQLSANIALPLVGAPTDGDWTHNAILYASVAAGTILVFGAMSLLRMNREDLK
ncbi:MAG: ABC transporter permease [Firmicutes bacterium]|nr:ABC transporter permease [Bacillota bacterium]